MGAAMPRKKPNESSLKNLVDRSAPDDPGQTEATTVRISVDDLRWLKSLPNGTSYHVRQAVKLYRESFAQPSE
ncbi:MAG: hypothetical protein KME13_23420 [Myxacorys californica WJT36-NPBG1]|jgi:hypothetical protein|nr:hypothetical protein [Myxacorys californica WJT36-NPBG1]